MVVASATFHGQAKKGLSEGIGPVGHVVRTVLFQDDTAFLTLQMVSIESRGQDLIPGWILQQVTG